QPIRGDNAALCIGPCAGGVGHTVANLQPGHLRPHLFHDSRTLPARYHRQATRRRVKAGTIVDVDEIEANRRVADQHLAWPWSARINFLVDQTLGSTGSVYANCPCSGHDFLAPSWGKSCNTAPMQNR